MRTDHEKYASFEKAVFYEMIRKTDLLTKRTKVTQEDSHSYTCR
jgi:hypothetical protein